MAAEIEYYRLGQQLHAGAPGVVLAQKKITIAVQEVQRDAPIREPAQTCSNPLLEFACSVITDPALEQVSEDIQCPGGRGALGQELFELFGDVGPIGAEVNIGDEQRDVALVLQRISTRSITTGSTGTSAIGPRLSVATWRISSTTSMPSVTRPNTA